MNVVVAAIVAALTIGETPRRGNAGTSSCITAEELTARVKSLAAEDWQRISADVALKQWRDLRAIGYNDATKQPVLFQRGVTLPDTGQPWCVERYFLAASRDHTQSPRLTTVELIHREEDRARAMAVAEALRAIIVPEPRPGPSRRQTLDDHAQGKRVFHVDHSWTRPTTSSDAGARESMNLDVREEERGFVIETRWSREPF